MFIFCTVNHHFPFDSTQHVRLTPFIPSYGRLQRAAIPISHMHRMFKKSRITFQLGPKKKTIDTHVCFNSAFESCLNLQRSNLNRNYYLLFINSQVSLKTYSRIIPSFSVAHCRLHDAEASCSLLLKLWKAMKPVPRCARFNFCINLSIINPITAHCWRAGQNVQWAGR